MDTLRNHDFIAREQNKFLQFAKSSLQPGQFVVLLDFAENYSFVVQDEVQSYHWTNAQATIHPSVACHKEDEAVVHDSFIITSDCLRHDTAAVHLFQTKMIRVPKSKV